MLAIIGGSGLSKLDILDNQETKSVVTPYGQAEVVVTIGAIHGEKVAFLPRHGADHVIPPHKINYRANIWALKEIGVTEIIAINAVGGIDPQLSPGQLAIPDQIIDYTYGRKHTFFEEDLTEVVHIDFSRPYSRRLRHLLVLMVESEDRESIAAIDSLPVTRGTYGCTQGPRLESAAEIARLKQDGCDMVGMTGMPEAALARELGLGYACLAVSVNRAAGLEEKPITMEAINQALYLGMGEVKKLLPVLVKLYADEEHLKEEAGSH